MTHTRPLCPSRPLRQSRKQPGLRFVHRGPRCTPVTPTLVHPYDHHLPDVLTEDAGLYASCLHLFFVLFVSTEAKFPRHKTHLWKAAQAAPIASIGFRTGLVPQKETPVHVPPQPLAAPRVSCVWWMVPFCRVVQGNGTSLLPHLRLPHSLAPRLSLPWVFTPPGFLSPC